MNKNKPVILAIYLINLFVILYFWWQGSGFLFDGDLGSSLLALGRLSGLVGMYSLLVQVTLISRGRWLEAKFGLDKLTRIHHWNGLMAMTLIIAHVFLVTRSYSLLTKVTIIEQYKTFLFSFPYIWLAAIGYSLLLLTVGLSLVIVRRHLRYEIWYYVHLFNYIALLSVFWHQIVNGGDFLASETFRLYWILLYVLALLNLFGFRFARPVWLYQKHKFKVAKVVAETPYSTSIYITGKNMGRFNFSAGQFAKWWFLAPGFKRESHPFTISIEPNGKYLRLTPKAVGDYTTKLKKLPKGTKVVVDGPYGIFTPRVAKSTTLLFIAGGIGITPIRAILGELAGSKYDVHLLYSVSSEADLTFKKEIDKLAINSNINVRYILANEKKQGFYYGRLDGQTIKELVPDVLTRDVYICGPPPMMKALSSELQKLGLPSSAIHTERFSL
jgi:predicted ferric reductase